MTTRNTISSLIISSVCLTACGGGGSPSDNPVISDPVSGIDTALINDSTLIRDPLLTSEPVLNNDPLQLKDPIAIYDPTLAADFEIDNLPVTLGNPVSTEKPVAIVDEPVTIIDPNTSPTDNPAIEDPIQSEQPVPGSATSGEPLENSATATTARFTVTLENRWGVDNFPQDFPDDAHLSLVGGATHNAAFSFWEPGEVVSRGMEDMAETGQIDILLLDEVADAITIGTADSMIEIRYYTDPQIDGVPGTNTFDIYMQADWPLVSMVTMLGPSPDWFVGVSGLSLREDGKWTSSLSVDLPLYDGGSKSDVTPIMGGPDIIPPNPVGLVAYDSATGVYLPSDEPQNVARLTFKRITTPIQ